MTTPEEKCWALFYWNHIARRQTTPMSVHGLNKRFAYGILSLSFVGSSSARILFFFGGITALISMWISNTATTAMMMPIGLGVASALAELLAKQTGRPVSAGRLRFTTGIMLMAAYASSTGGIGTPVGSPPNLIGLAMLDKFTGVKIPFFRWMMFAVPLLLVISRDGCDLATLQQFLA